MAQQEAAKEHKKEAKAPAVAKPREPVNAVEAAKDAESTARLFEFLRSYNPIGSKEVMYDMLSDRYRIDITSPLAELDTPLCKAYEVRDTGESKSEHQLYALITNKAYPFRSKAIPKLKANNCPHMVQLVASGVVTFSKNNDEQFVLIFERPAGVRLSDFLAANRNLGNDFICERIIAPIAAAIHHMESLDIPHGTIHPDNIYMNQFAMLGQCIAEPCGYSQPFQFESLERMQAMPAAKGEGSPEADYHALAVLVLYSLFGPGHFNRFGSARELARAILREGEYNALLMQKDMSEMFFDLFRGIFSHNPEDRWDYSDVRNWLDGKRYHALSPPTPAEASRPFEFAGTEANTKRELAHLLVSDWEHINDVLLNNKLSQWVAASLRNKDLADSIIRISRTIGDMGSRNEAQVNDQITRLIMIMDTEGPLRIKHLSTHIDGIDGLFAALYANKATQDLQLLMYMIEYNTVGEWIEMHRKRPDYTMPANINAAVLKQDRLRPYLKTGGLGFGVERVLYDLNPDMPCQSPMLINSYICTLQDLLRKLDALAPSLAKDQDPIDVHIAAFIASKINIPHEIQLRELSAIPALANNRTMYALYLLSSAQVRTDLRLPGLTHWLALRLFPILEPIHSTTIRKDLKAHIMDRVSGGHIQRLSQLILNANYINADKTGFDQAVATYQLNQAKIKDFHRSRTVEKQRAQLAYSMARICSYMALLTSIFIVLQG